MCYPSYDTRIVIHFDAPTGCTPGYCAAYESILPGEGLGESGWEPVGDARRCASGNAPPASVVRAARKALMLGDAEIEWTRLDAGNGWEGRPVTRGAWSTLSRDLEVITGCTGTYVRDDDGKFWRPTARATRAIRWSRHPAATALRLARSHDRTMGSW
jgi:hypothetical protein